MPAPLRIAVLASGRGSNFAALLAARERSELPVEFVLVASDKADAPVLQFAQSAGVPTTVLDPRGYSDRRAYDVALFDRIGASKPDLLVLAGFMRIIDGEALKPWTGRMINIHPSLLPKYRGLHTHRRALKAGDLEHGASVHYVTAELDGGPVIAQTILPIEAGDNENTLAARLLPLEHQLLPAVVALLAAGRLALSEEGITFDNQPLRKPLRWKDGELVR
ncbi:phosphoribosylglycinamide formyltransferase [Dyella nitratireducens]|uniref:Phosphoribosylglycinamide formyltransferase n=1 Tax=Dyella nitratireducens TaxID=1849580 RepID=A0ABQ1FNZ3_9GAMM|nr:phosphoribosylglycinamide formyltransferase [Dyella nitratireducens]GGA22330.1 phosphoribosylglycinamide formyltransferase [Dyella nitratireducens]GLQ44125.1 phosphoribosylglycinamide formyltransferase [Dyella nitratireducens]